MNKHSVVERIEVQPESLFYHEHVARYQFAKQHVRPGRTLDIASGSGYGSETLQRDCGGWVVGVDIDQSSLHTARKVYPNPSISFLAGSGTALPLASCAFQNIISLETIEHIADDRGFLRELTRVLRPDGVCILSTPNRAYSEKQGITNPYHVREYHEDELLQLLSIYFGSVELFHQGFVREYHDQVRDYANAIQEQKKQLNPLVQWGIHKLYRPIKRYIPVAATSYFIHKLLRLSYPQPKPTAITISEGMVEGCNVFIAVCQEPP